MADYYESKYKPEPNKYNIVESAGILPELYCITCGARTPKMLTAQKLHYNWHQSEDGRPFEVAFEEEWDKDKEDPHKFDEYQREVLNLLEQIVANTSR